MAELTKKEKYAKIASLLANDTEIVDFCKHEIELLEKKNIKAVEAKKTENDEIIKAILGGFSIRNTEYHTISEWQELIPELANLKNQKMSALLTKLVNEGKVSRIVEKRKPFFKISD